jgi:hypothetical protein
MPQHSRGDAAALTRRFPFHSRGGSLSTHAAMPQHSRGGAAGLMRRCRDTHAAVPRHSRGGAAALMRRRCLRCLPVAAEQSRAFSACGHYRRAPQRPELMHDRDAHWVLTGYSRVLKGTQGVLQGTHRRAACAGRS